jgi:hypothetical protein
MLAVFEVEEADNLQRALSRLFATGSEWQEKLTQARCYVRYAMAPSSADRRSAAAALKNWLNSQRDTAGQVFEQIPRSARSIDGAAELKTKAEQAVDRVTQGMRLSKEIPAGF